MYNSKTPIFEVKNLGKSYKMKRNLYLKAVDNISFSIKKNETLGLVGESGSGKSTCGRLCVGLENQTAGKVYFDGKDISLLKGKEKQEFHKKAQLIFQDPYFSLNPRMKVGDIIAEGIDIHGIAKDPKDRDRRIKSLLNQVGLNEEHMNRYPDEFSGGQRQRIGIARALAVEPEFIVCDEAISALDVSIQAQIVNLLVELQKSHGLTYLFIAHDLSMVKYISDRIAVMHLGEIVEMTDSKLLYKNPMHPYTQALLSAVPIPDPEVEDKRNRIKLTGELPSPIGDFKGCKFRSRCKKAISICADEAPILTEKEEGHLVACHCVQKVGNVN